MSLAERFLRRLDAMRSDTGPTTKAVTVRMDFDTVAAVDVYAQRYELSRSEFIAQMVMAFLDDLRKVEPLSEDEFKAAYLKVHGEVESE